MTGPAAGSHSGVQREHIQAPSGGTLEALVLSATDPFPARLEVIPDAGMVASSFTVRGHELLGQRQGLAGYIERGKTFGIPLLAPWANRLSGPVYTVCDTTVDVSGVPGVGTDANGLPIHGLLAGTQGWHVSEAGIADPRDSAGMQALDAEAVLDFDDRRPEFPAFPFAHRLQVRYRLIVAPPESVPALGWQLRLEVRTVISPTGPDPVPIAFGWHPYFQVPWVAREEWEVAIPFTRHAALDDRCVPTGMVTTEPATREPLGSVTYDDLYTDVPDLARVHIGFSCPASAGPSGQLVVEYTSGYPYAILYAPDSDPVIAVEPMAAPTDPFGGAFPVRTVEPGSDFAATWAVEVFLDGYGEDRDDVDGDDRDGDDRGGHDG